MACIMDNVSLSLYQEINEMKIQALTVCVNYADFFVHVVEANIELFDKWIVVTDTKDEATALICETYGLTCIKTDIFYKDGKSFDKAAGINEGLASIDQDTFVLFLDADVVLPPLTKRAFESLEFKKDTLYGCDRVYVKGYDAYKEYLATEGVIRENWLMHFSGFPFGARICQYYGQVGENGRFRGWLPLGFFQLAHRSAFTVIPDGHGKADHYDIAFASQFSRDKRVMVPEILALHLESPGQWKGQNWRGRVSPPFVSEIPGPEDDETDMKINPSNLVGHIRRYF